jgi:serine/threonine protein kinase/tetratricopeptide (TPR) repeat protein
MHDESNLAAAVAEEARKRSPEQRTAYLDGVCAARPELRDGVERLLRETGHSVGSSSRELPEGPARLAGPTNRPDHEVTAQFTPSGGRAAPNPYDATMMPTDTVIGEGASVGPYKLLQELGAGGMGVVYMAEQQHPVRRKVALKIIKPGMDTREVLARFEAERQALSMMDHPNIARVLDANSTQTGSPYFVMELVKGVPMTEYCDMEKLDTRQRLELFIDVCRAVQHAHQKGIIHRDLKPLNILVSMGDSGPVPKVIDFGVAKAIGTNLTEKTLFTRINQPVGTPAYMSPEQAEMTGLDIDTRSDIYALGVLLYELLTGTTPLSAKRLVSASFLEMQRIIREEEPQRPSTRLSTLGDAKLSSLAGKRKIEPTRLGAKIEEELDWIVMKALEKDRTRRYDTAAAFAQDVDNFLKGEMVLARPPSTAYRLSKFARRYKSWIATAAAMILLLIAGTVVSTWQAIRAKRAEEVATQERNVARSAQREAEEARDREKTINAFLVNAFRSPDAERDGRQITVAELIDRAADDVATEFKDKPLTKADLLGALGTTYKSLGMPQEAISLLTQAQEVWQANGLANRPDVLMRLTTLASAYFDAGDHKRAQDLYSSSLLKMRVSLKSENKLTMATGRYMADILLAAGQTKAAIGLYEEVLKQQRAHLAADDKETLITEANLAFAQHRIGRSDEAIEGLEAVLQKYRDSLGGESPRTLETMNLLATVNLEADKIRKAIELFEETHKRRQEVLGPTHWATLNTAGLLAQAYRRDGQTDKAISVHEATLDQLRDTLSPTHPRTLVSMNNLAVALGQGGRAGEGIALLKDALEKMQVEMPADHPETLKAATNLAHLYWTTGAVEDALRVQQEVMKESRRIHEADDVRTLTAEVRLVEIYVAKRAFVEAALLAEEVLDKLGAGPEHAPMLATLQPPYAAALVSQGKFEQARGLAQQALDAYQPTSDGDWHHGRLQSLLGSALLGLKQFADAEPLLLSGLETLQKNESEIPVQCKGFVNDAAKSLATLYEERARPGDDELATKYRAIASAGSQ